MSLKPVEMQIAIPRTTEATAIQNQLNQKPAQDQAALAGQTLKRAERERKKSTEVEESTFLHVREDGKSGGSGYEQSKKRKRSDSSAEAADQPDSGHPYKGRHIDISL